MRRATAQRIGSCTAGVLVLAGELALAGPLDPGTRLCLQSPDLPIANAAADPRTADLQARLIKALEAASFVVPDPAAVDAVVERVAEKAAGIIDPYTGRWDPAGYEARRAAVSQALQTELNCQARMVAEVRPVLVRFQDGMVSWDGETEFISSEGRVILNALAGRNEWGFVPALSLWLRVLDLVGDEIAFRSAGIEVLVEFAVLKDKDLLPEDRWLKDEKKVDAAIGSALGAAGSALRLEGNPHSKPSS